MNFAHGFRHQGDGSRVRSNGMGELDGKVAVIYGTGAIGSAVARAFAGEGATVHLGGRTEAHLEEVAASIRGAGGVARTGVVDALDPVSVSEFTDAVVAESGRIDVGFNLINHGDVHGTPLLEMDVEDFVRPIDSMVRSTLLTSQAVARQMVQQDEGGVILFFGGEGLPLRDYFIGGTQVAFNAQEFMRRQLATELGAQGVRVITIISGGIPESIDEIPAEVAEVMAAQGLVGRAATFADVGNAAVFAASDRARIMTAATLNISAGAIID
jgi:NADP-dependent 3-hydroxy acid dehydrogenase YdfG